MAAPHPLSVVGDVGTVDPNRFDILDFGPGSGQFVDRRVAVQAQHDLDPWLSGPITGVGIAVPELFG